MVAQHPDCVIAVVCLRSTEARDDARHSHVDLTQSRGKHAWPPILDAPIRSTVATVPTMNVISNDLVLRHAALKLYQ